MDSKYQHSTYMIYKSKEGHVTYYIKKNVQNHYLLIYPHPTHILEQKLNVFRMGDVNYND